MTQKYIFEYEISDAFSLSSEKAEFICYAPALYIAHTQWSDFKEDALCCGDIIKLLRVRIEDEKDILGITRYIIEGSDDD